MEEKNIKPKKQSITSIIIILLLLILIILLGLNLYFIFNKSNNTSTNIDNESIQSENVEQNKTSIKEDENKDLVYSKETYKVPNSTIEIEMPYLNLSTEDAKKVNQELLERYNSAINSTKIEKDGNGIFKIVKYEFFNIDNKYLSLLVYDEAGSIPGGAALSNRKVYYINLENGKSDTFENLIKSLGYSFSYIKNQTQATINSKFNDTAKDVKYDENTICFKSENTFDVLLIEGEFMGPFGIDVTLDK